MTYEKMTVRERCIVFAREHLKTGPATSRELCDAMGFSGPTTPMIEALRVLAKKKEAIPPDTRYDAWRLGVPPKGTRVKGCV